MNKKEAREIATRICSELPFEVSRCYNNLNDAFWAHKTPFPVLESVAVVLHSELSEIDLMELIGYSVKENRMGSYVVAGKSLQLLLKGNLKLYMQRAVDFMIYGNEWYVCDIIAERVFGHGLLIEFQKTFNILKSYVSHENMWIRRAIGIAVHYAVKNKLGLPEVEKLFYLLAEQAEEKNIHIKKGCGWGIESIGKYHPEFMMSKRGFLENKPNLNPWIRKKIDLGLEKSRYFKRSVS